MKVDRLPERCSLRLWVYRHYLIGHSFDRLVGTWEKWEKYEHEHFVNMVVHCGLSVETLDGEVFNAKS